MTATKRKTGVKRLFTAIMAVLYVVHCNGNNGIRKEHQ